MRAMGPHHTSKFFVGKFPLGNTRGDGVPQLANEGSRWRLEKDRRGFDQGNGLDEVPEG